MFTQYDNHLTSNCWIYNIYYLKCTILEKYMSLMEYRINSAVAFLKYKVYISGISRRKTSVHFNFTEDK